MNIWTVTYNDDNGSPSSSVHLSANEANKAAAEWVEAYRDSYGDVVDFDQEDWGAIFDALTEQIGFMDAVTIQKHQVSVSINDLWGPFKTIQGGFLKGSFGVLYDPQEVLEMLDGYNADIDDDNSSAFDASNPEDVSAITAWCEAEAESFEDEFSHVFWNNLPTRKEAYEKLEREQSE